MKKNMNLSKSYILIYNHHKIGVMLYILVSVMKENYEQDLEQKSNLQSLWNFRLEKINHLLLSIIYDLLSPYYHQL